MPVKWSPDMDQLLLLKIIETHDFRIDHKKIVDAWPDNKGEVPTPRAISERIFKLRSTAKRDGVSITSKAKGAPSRSELGMVPTPQKRNRGTSSTTGTSQSAGRRSQTTAANESAESPSKRKHGTMNEAVEIKKELAELGGGSIQYPLADRTAASATPGRNTAAKFRHTTSDRIPLSDIPGSEESEQAQQGRPIAKRAKRESVNQPANVDIGDVVGESIPGGYDFEDNYEDEEDYAV